MATHSSILAWRLSYTEEPGGATVHRVTKSQTDLVTKRQQLQHHLFQGAFPELHMFKQLFPWVQTVSQVTNPGLGAPEELNKCPCVRVCMIIVVVAKSCPTLL